MAVVTSCENALKMDGWMDGWMEGRLDGWMDGQIRFASTYR